MMIIAQLSDLHIVAAGQRCQDWVDTAERLHRCVQHLNQLQPLPDVVLVTGDLTENGWPEEYAVARSQLDQLLMPYYIVPGNHDRRANMLAAFHDHPYLPSPDSQHVLYSIDEYPIRLIGVDTALRGEPYGRVCATRLDWLSDTLGQQPDKPTVMFMHHPPIRTGIRWIDAAGLYGSRQLEAIVRENPQVQRILCGHVHRSIQVCWANTLVSTAPSSCHAQLALTLDETQGYRFAYQLEAISIPLLVWDPHYGLLSHLSSVEPQSETREPSYASALQTRFREAYHDFCIQEYERDARFTNVARAQEQQQ